MTVVQKSFIPAGAAPLIDPFGRAVTYIRVSVYLEKNSREGVGGRHWALRLATLANVQDFVQVKHFLELSCCQQIEDPA